MFLSDEQLEQMTGITRQGRRPGTLRSWLVERGWTENVDFFKRADGWYSVLHPAHRAAVEVPRPKVRRRA